MSNFCALTPSSSSSPDLSLRDDVIHHHVNHRPRRERQHVRQQRFCQDHSDGPEQSSDGLHHPTQLAVPEEGRLSKMFVLCPHTDGTSPTRRPSMATPPPLAEAGSQQGLLENSGSRCQWPDFCRETKQMLHRVLQDVTTWVGQVPVKSFRRQTAALRL